MEDSRGWSYFTVYGDTPVNKYYSSTYHVKRQGNKKQIDFSKTLASKRLALYAFWQHENLIVANQTLTKKQHHKEFSTANCIKRYFPISKKSVLSLPECEPLQTLFYDPGHICRLVFDRDTQAILGVRILKDLTQYVKDEKSIVPTVPDFHKITQYEADARIK